MSKKVGIITFHAAHNCGSILQAYGLQTVLKNKMNIESEIIDFSNKGQREYYSVYVPTDSFKHLVKNIFTFFVAGKVKKEYEQYEKYIHENLMLTKKRYLSTEELTELKDEYDCLICGSDQVWNVTCVDADDAYFLSFASGLKKIAYATSLGAKNINKYANDIEKYKRYISDFSAISVREANGKKWIDELMSGVGPKVDITADPTLLLNRDEWNVRVKNAIVPGKYIFYYAFNYTKEVNEAVKKISKKFNMSVYMFDVKSWGVKGNFRFGFKLADEYGPEAFLSLVKNAEMVLTTSFHGTVFSTIFEKNFWYLDSSMHSKDDDRARYLLQQLGLKNRLIDISKVDATDLRMNPDFSNSRILVEKLKKNSIEFLQKHIFDGADNE